MVPVPGIEGPRKSNCALSGAQAPRWRGWRREHAGAPVTDERRSQRGCMGRPKVWSGPCAGPHFCTGFCARCGSNLPWLTRTGRLFIVPAGALDTDPGIRPTRVVHMASRAPRYLPGSALPACDEEAAG